MLIALTGTPGTGKSTVASILHERGHRICLLNELAERCGALRRYNEDRKTWEVDLALVERHVPRERPLILVGHMAHLLAVDVAIVLRCHPDVLRQRLEKRGWSATKVRENVEAEAIGVITVEAMERVETFEVDTTSTTAEEAARAVLDIIRGRGERYTPGKVDWSEVILGWY